MKPTLLRFFLDDNEDDELVCIVCNQDGCEQSFTTRGHGVVSIKGVHSRCAQKSNDLMTKTSEES